MTGIAQIKELLQSVTRSAGKEFDNSKIQILDRGIPHIPKSLPNGTMGIYMFEYQGCFLKIGKVGAKSNARFLSQHYNSKSSKSNLAKSILLDSSITNMGIDESNVGKWIKNNTRRIDILLDENLGMFTLNFFEASLPFKYLPKYEGFENQLH